MCLGIFQIYFKDEFCSDALLLSPVNSHIKREARGHTLPSGIPPAVTTFCLRFWMTAGGVFKQTGVVTDIEKWSPVTLISTQ